MTFPLDFTVPELFIFILKLLKVPAPKPFAALILPVSLRTLPPAIVPIRPPPFAAFILPVSESTPVGPDVSPDRCSLELSILLQAGHARKPDLSDRRRSSWAHLVETQMSKSEKHSIKKNRTYLACRICAHGKASKQSASTPNTSPQTPQFNPKAASVWVARRDWVLYCSSSPSAR